MPKKSMAATFLRQASDNISLAEALKPAPDKKKPETTPVQDYKVQAVGRLISGKDTTISDILKCLAVLEIDGVALRIEATGRIDIGIIDKAGKY